MRRALRVVGWAAAAVVVLLVVAVVGVRAYLATGSARSLVAGEIAKVVGGPVVVTAIRPGMGSTGITVELPAAGPGPQPVPPLLSGRITADVSVFDLAAGRQPTKVTVDDAVLTLRLDKDGKPLDALPDPQGGGGGGTIPEVVINRATLRVVQAGKPDFQIGGVSATVAPAGGKLKIDGTIDDPVWGKWTASGVWAGDGKTGDVTVALDAPAALKQEMLLSLPFVPPAAWDEVKIDGQATGNVKLSLTPDGLNYRVELAPTATTVTIPAIDLTLTDTSGSVMIDGSKVVLTGVRGHAADGEVLLDTSTLDFGPADPVLSFRVRAKGLDVRKLPAAWGLPRTIEGKLRGAADLTLVLKEGTVVPRVGKPGEAGAKGVLDDAKVAGFPAEVEIWLRERGGRLRFDTGEGASSRLPASPPPGGGSKSARGSFRAALAALAVALLQAPPAAAQPAPAKPADQPTYVTANLKLNDVDLAELLRRLDVPVPVKLGGKITVAVSASIPLSDPGTLRTYRVRGRITLPEFRVEDLTLKDVAADITFRDGVLSLASLTAKVPTPGRADAAPGDVFGKASYGVDPPADLTADLRLTDVPLGQVFKALPSLAGQADGTVTGNVALRMPAEKLTDVTAAVADGQVTSPGLTVVGRKVGKTTVALNLRNGEARITSLETSVEGLPVIGAAALGLTGNLPFSATVRTKPDEPVSVRKLAPEADLPFELSGLLGVSARATGTVSPLTYKVDGKAHATDLVVGSAKLGALTFDWGIDPDALTVSNVAASGYQGELNGSIRVPLSGTAAGEFKVELKDVDATALTKDLPSMPVKLDGRFNGTISGGLPTGEKGAKSPPIKVDLDAPKMRVQGIPTTRLRGTATYQPGKIVYDLKGDALGGTFDVDGVYPLSTEPPPKPGPSKAVPAPDTVVPAAATTEDGAGEIRLTGVRLGRVATDLGLAAVGPLRGRVDARVRYSFDAGGNPVGSGRVTVTDFGWGGERERSDLSATIRLTPLGIETSDLAGRVAGGDLRARARYLFARSDRSFFNVTVDRAEASKLLAPFGLDLGERDSRVTINVRGGLGREFRGTGAISTGRGTFAGVAVNELRLPFDWAFVPGDGGQVAFREVGGFAAGGRVNGTALYRWGATGQLQGSLKFVDVSVRQATGTSAGITAGRMSGRFDFSGTDVRSVNDVRGLLIADFGGEESLFDLPVLRVIAPFLSVGRLTAPFEDGDLRARLANGRFNVERLTLIGPNVQLFASGLVGLDGRLDLDVVARTSNLSIDPTALRLFRVRVPAFGPLPITLVLEVSRFLSNRTVRLKVVGPAKQPSVTVNVAAILAEEAVRYFLGVDTLTGGAVGTSN